MVDQAEFTHAVLNPTVAAPAGLTNPDGAQASKRFDVYRNNIAASLTEALETGFPVLRKLLGKDFFKAMSGVYLRQHPPTSQLMMFYGQDMPAFLAGFEPVRHLPYLADVARLELALRQSYHAADTTALAPETLQELPTARLMAARMVFAPAIVLIRSRWPVHGIWRMNMEEAALKPGTQGENVLVTRPEFDPQLTTLAPGGGTFVAALMTGARFTEALDTAIAQVPDFDLTATLGVLFAGAAITGLNED